MYEDYDDLTEEQMIALQEPHEHEFRCRGCEKTEKGQAFRLPKSDELDDEELSWHMSPPPGWFVFMWPRAMNVIFGFACSRQCAG